MTYIFISDLDGTLLNRAGKVSDYTKSVVQKCIQHGHYFGIATSRSPEKAKHLISGLETNFPNIYLNGAVIEFSDKKRVLNTIDKKTTSNLIDNIFNKWQVTPFVLGEEHKKDRLFYYGIENAGKSHFLDSRKNDPRLKESTIDSQPDEVLLLNFMIATVDSSEFEAYLRSLLTDSLTYTVSKYIYLDGFTNFEIISKNATKKNAFKYALQNLNIPNATTIGFGDEGNDLDILTFTDIAVAPKNASHTIQKICNEVVESNDDDGIAKYIEKCIS